ncbi:DUF2948 family protein [Algicella marina]|uniref:DUF2948 family protein n=1 Tax=Algicella marina TaxID=2683284 RepID=A0A6P1T0T9_9RHOB|nr:DUF2948 family protein [Algicella marina]QHQ35351.1 DUF2948 family protein [Algicella marina]
MQDATFEDGAERPLNIYAESNEDVVVMSALLQDSVLETGDISWMPRRRRLALLCNRFRWEEKDRAETAGRPFERVRSLLIIEDVQAVSSNGIDPKEKDTVLSILQATFEPGEDGTGKLVLTFAGDGQIVADVECLGVILKDVTRPYKAISGSLPSHDI